MFGIRPRMKDSTDPDWLELEQLYEKGRQLTLRGKAEEARNRFEEIFGITTDFRDVTQAVVRYCCPAKRKIRQSRQRRPNAPRRHQ